MLKKIVTCIVLSGAALQARATDLVVIVHPSAPSLTKEEVADVFLGRAPRAVPIDLPRESALHAEFYQRATGRDLAQIRSIWSRVIFTGKGLAPKEYPDAAAVKKAVAENRRAVGYIQKSALDGTVKLAHELE